LDFFKNALDLGRTCSMRLRGRLFGPQSREISTAVAVAHENGFVEDIDVLSPRSPSPHDAADGTAAVDNPACAVVGVLSQLEALQPALRLWGLKLSAMYTVPCLARTA